MHLYALPFEQREAYDEDLARHPAVAPANALAMKWCGVDLLQSQLLCRCFSEDNIVPLGMKDELRTYDSLWLRKIMKDLHNTLNEIQSDT